MYTLLIKAIPLPFVMHLKEHMKGIHQFKLIQGMQVIEEPLPLNSPMRRSILHFIISLKRCQDIWAVLPKRRVVERTFSWLNNFRRSAKGFLMLMWTSENMIRIAMIRMTHRKIRMMFSRSAFKAGTMKSEFLSLCFLLHLCKHYPGLMR